MLLEKNNRVYKLKIVILITLVSIEHQKELSKGDAEDIINGGLELKNILNGLKEKMSLTRPYANEDEQFKLSIMELILESPNTKGKFKKKARQTINLFRIRLKNKYNIEHENSVEQRNLKRHFNQSIKTLLVEYSDTTVEIMDLYKKYRNKILLLDISQEKKELYQKKLLEVALNAIRLYKE